MSDAGELAVVVLQQVTRLLQELTPDQIHKLADGKARLAFMSENDVVTAPKGRRPSRRTRPSIATAVEQLRQAESVDQRRECLESGLRIEDLKAVAKQLDISLKGCPRKAQIIDRITGGEISKSSTRAEADAGARSAVKSGLERLMGGPWKDKV